MQLLFDCRATNEKELGFRKKTIGIFNQWNCVLKDIGNKKRVLSISKYST